MQAILKFQPGARPDSTTPTRRRGLPVPTRLRRDLTRLIGQQFWLFGCDVRRPEGNVLSDLGFIKSKAPLTGKIVPSRYHAVLPRGDTLVLWGFGMLWTNADSHAVFIPRHRFAPLSTTCGDRVPDAWSAEEIPNLHPPATQECPICGGLVLTALDWLIDYERHVLDCRGRNYRNDTINAWRTPFGTADDLIDRWQYVRQDLAESLSSSI